MMTLIAAALVRTCLFTPDGGKPQDLEVSGWTATLDGAPAELAVGDHFCGPHHFRTGWVFHDIDKAGRHAAVFTAAFDVPADGTLEAGLTGDWFFDVDIDGKQVFTTGDNGGETAQAIALEFGLCEGAAEIAAAQAALVKAFADADDHLTMGIVGMTQAFRALSFAGRTDLAFKVLTQPTAPSPAAWIARGSTSLWEDWEEGGSRNHIMFGDFAAWAYERLAGIVPIEPGFRRFRLAPEPIEALDFVEAETETPYGKIKSVWRRTEGRVSYRFVVPAGTRADVRLPDGTVRMLDSGEYVFP